MIEKYQSVHWGSPELGSAGLKMMEVACDSRWNYYGMTGEIFPYMRSHIPTHTSFLSANAHMHVCVCQYD